MRLGPISSRSQNLSDGALPLWRSGRAWWRFPTCWSKRHDYHEESRHREYSAGRCRNVRGHLEWHFLKWRPVAGIGVTIHAPFENDQFSGHLQLPGAELYWSVDGLLNRDQERRWLPSDDREISLRFHDSGIWWTIWWDDSIWRRTDPWWRRGAFFPLDILFGRQEHRVVSEQTSEVAIPMPERTYRGTCTIKHEQWKRPRLPWPSLTIMRGHLNVPGGVPQPGKGENAWDSGEDAIYGMACPAAIPEGAVRQLVESVSRNRLRYGGPNWRPEVAAQL